MNTGDVVKVLNILLARTSASRRQMGEVYERNITQERSPYQNPDWTRIEGAVAIENEIRKLIKEIKDDSGS